jgi:predicted dehydrogenase
VEGVEVKSGIQERNRHDETFLSYARRSPCSTHAGRAESHRSAAEYRSHPRREAKRRIPVVGKTVAGYGCENRDFVRCFREGRQPGIEFRVGLEVVQMLVSAYRSAEEGRSLA